MKAKVLTTGSDQILIDSRTRILQREYEAFAARPEEALPRLRSESFDLLLVCCSIPFDRATDLIRQAHQEFPSLCIVRLLSADSPPVSSPIAHKLVTVDFRPEVWMAAVHELLSSSSRVLAAGNN